MNVVEQFLLNSGFSWMWSKLSIFIFIFLVSLTIAIFLLIKTHWSKFLKIPLAIFITVLPFTIYFIFYPIYTGDLIDESKKVSSNYLFPSNKTLNIFVLKGCPFCENTIEYMIDLHNRKPVIPIRYIIIGERDDKFPGFTNKIPSYCEKVYEPSGLKAGELTEGNYPCYVLSKNGKGEKKWFNDSFGMKSMDIIEAFFEE